MTKLGIIHLLFIILNRDVSLVLATTLSNSISEANFTTIIVQSVEISYDISDLSSTEKTTKYDGSLDNVTDLTSWTSLNTTHDITTTIASTEATTNYSPSGRTSTLAANFSITTYLCTWIGISTTVSPSSVVSVVNSTNGFNVTLTLFYGIIGVLGMALVVTIATCIIILTCRTNEQKKGRRSPRNNRANESSGVNQQIERIDLTIMPSQNLTHASAPPEHGAYGQEPNSHNDWKGKSPLLLQPSDSSQNLLQLIIEDECTQDKSGPTKQRDANGYHGQQKKGADGCGSQSMSATASHAPSDRGPANFSTCTPIPPPPSVTMGGMTKEIMEMTSQLGITGNFGSQGNVHVASNATTTNPNSAIKKREPDASKVSLYAISASLHDLTDTRAPSATKGNKSPNPLIHGSFNSAFNQSDHDYDNPTYAVVKSKTKSKSAEQLDNIDEFRAELAARLRSATAFSGQKSPTVPVGKKSSTVPRGLASPADLGKLQPPTALGGQTKEIQDFGNDYDLLRRPDFEGQQDIMGPVNGEGSPAPDPYSKLLVSTLKQQHRPHKSTENLSKDNFVQFDESMFSSPDYEILDPSPY